MEGTVFNIQHFCTQDGPGVRTTVFVKGCHLRCAWCHNPESQAFGREILYYPEKCIGCGACARVCGCHSFADGRHVFDREKCVRCGKCAGACPARALESCGKRMTAADAAREAAADAMFYEESRGGVTISGGEPLDCLPFTKELLSELKKNGIRTAIETSGDAEWERIEELLPLTDLFLYDIKLTDSYKHRIYTGVGNERILENLDKLDRAGAAIILRCPMIPGVNMDGEHFRAIARLAEKSAHVAEVQLEPYHPLGLDKCARLGRKPAYAEENFLEADEVRTAWDKWVNGLSKKVSVL